MRLFLAFQGEVICIPVVLPASTSANTPDKGNQRFHPGHKASKNPSDNVDLGFQAVGPALRFMQLNVEGLSAAKRHIIQSLAEIDHIDVICLQETHVNADKFDHLQISGFDIISYTLHVEHGLDV